MYRLTNPVRRYDWGSTQTIPEFLGMVPDGTPFAEVWMSAHPDSASLATPVHFGIVPDTEDATKDCNCEPLDALIERDPTNILGNDCLSRFGPTLPFLAKFLAADRTLSLQVHPSLAHAKRGYQYEVSAQVPRSERNYVDANHKPEILLALEPTLALVGFRPIEESIAAFERIGGSIGRKVVEVLAGEGATAEKLRHAFTTCMEITPVDKEEFFNSLPSRDAQQLSSDPLEVAGIIAKDHQDGGVAASLLLNTVLLEPGQGLYIGAGVPHAYIQGFGLEVMASSDNVLRAGLTTKKIDLEELFNVVSFAPSLIPLVLGVTERLEGGSETTYRTPETDFALSVLDVEESQLELTNITGGPVMLICLSGLAQVSTSQGIAAVKQGDALLLSERAGTLLISGTARVAMVTVGQE